MERVIDCKRRKIKKQKENNKLKRIRFTSRCFVEKDANVLIIDSTGCKTPAKVKELKAKGELNCTIFFSIETFTAQCELIDIEKYDYIFTYADKTIWNSKGMFEWSRFIRNHVAMDKYDETEDIINYMRSMGGKDCVYFKKKDDFFIWKKGRMF